MLPVPAAGEPALERILSIFAALIEGPPTTDNPVEAFQFFTTHEFGATAPMTNIRTMAAIAATTITSPVFNVDISFCKKSPQAATMRIEPRPLCTLLVGQGLKKL